MALGSASAISSHVYWAFELLLAQFVRRLMLLLVAMKDQGRRTYC